MNSSTGSVSQIAAGLVIFHCAMMVPWNSSTTHDRHQPHDERPQPRRPDQAGQLVLAVERQRPGGLLRQHHLQRHRRDEHRHRQERPKLAILRFRGLALDRKCTAVMNTPAAHGGDHEPAALAEERGAMRGGGYGGGFDFFSQHGTWRGPGRFRFKKTTAGSAAAAPCRAPAQRGKSIHPPYAPAQCRPGRTPRSGCRHAPSTEASQK